MLRLGDTFDLCANVFFFWMAVGMAILVLFGYSGLYDSFVGNTIVWIVNAVLPIVGDGWVWSKHYEYIEFFLCMFLLLMPIVVGSFIRCIRNADDFFYYLLYGGNARRNILLIVISTIFFTTIMYFVFFQKSPDLDGNIIGRYEDTIYQSKFFFTFIVTTLICLFCQLFATSVYIVANMPVILGDKD